MPAPQPPEPEAPVLTRWHPDRRPKSEKLARAQAAKIAYEMALRQLTEAQQQADRLKAELTRYGVGGSTPNQAMADQVAKKLHAHIEKFRLLHQQAADLRSAHSIIVNGPDDLGLHIHAIRMECRATISLLVGNAGRRFEQHKLPWNVGAGQCAAFAFEYILRRRTNVSPEEIVKHLADASAEDRMSTVQASVRQRYKTRNELAEAVSQYPKDRLFSASLLHDAKNQSTHLHSTPLFFMHDILQQSHQYPANVAKKKLLGRCQFQNFDFSLEAVVALWPTDKVVMPTLARYGPATQQPVPLASAAPTFNSSSSSSSSLAQTPGPSSGHTSGQRSNLEPHRIVKEDIAQYATQLRPLFHCIQSGLDGSCFLLTIDTATGYGHAMVLDTSKGSPGIFDPNVGFIPFRIRMNSNFSVNFSELSWLLALLLIQYDVKVMQLYTLERDPPGSYS